MDIQADASPPKTQQLPVSPFAYLPEITSIIILVFSIIYVLSLFYLATYPETIVYGFYALYSMIEKLALTGWLAVFVVGMVFLVFLLISISKKPMMTGLILGLSLLFMSCGGVLGLFAAPSAIDRATLADHNYTLFYDFSLDGEYYNLYTCDRISLFCYRLYRSEFTYFDKTPILVVNDKNETVSIMVGDDIIYTHQTR